MAYMMIILVTVTAVLTETTASPLKLVFKSRNGLKTKTTRTMETRNVNTTQNPTLAERGKYILPPSPIVTKTLIEPESGHNTKKTTIGTKSEPGTNMGKDEFSTTDNSINDTKNEQEYISHTTVPTMHSAYSTNSYLATNDSTAFSHHQDNSEHIGIIVGLTFSALVVVTTIVVGLVFLCFHKKFLCFKRNEEGDLERSYMPMVAKTTKTSDAPVDGNVASNVDVENIDTQDTTDDEVDISSANANCPVLYTYKYNNIQPTDARE